MNATGQEITRTERTSASDRELDEATIKAADKKKANKKREQRRKEKEEEEERLKEEEEEEMELEEARREREERREIARKAREQEQTRWNKEYEEREKDEAERAQKRRYEEETRQSAHEAAMEEAKARETMMNEMRREMEEASKQEEKEKSKKRKRRRRSSSSSSESESRSRSGSRDRMRRATTTADFKDDYVRKVERNATLTTSRSAEIRRLMVLGFSIADGIEEAEDDATKMKRVAVEATRTIEAMVRGLVEFDADGYTDIPTRVATIEKKLIDYMRKHGSRRAANKAKEWIRASRSRQ